MALDIERALNAEPRVYVASLSAVNEQDWLTIVDSSSNAVLYREQYYRADPRKVRAALESHFASASFPKKE